MSVAAVEKNTKTTHDTTRKFASEVHKKCVLNGSLTPKYAELSRRRSSVPTSALGGREAKYGASDNKGCRPVVVPELVCEEKSDLFRELHLSNH